MYVLWWCLLGCADLLWIRKDPVRLLWKHLKCLFGLMISTWLDSHYFLEKEISAAHLNECAERLKAITFDSFPSNCKSALPENMSNMCLCAFIQERGFKLFLHLLCTPDLSPSDYYPLQEKQSIKCTKNKCAGFLKVFQQPFCSLFSNAFNTCAESAAVAARSEAFFSLSGTNSCKILLSN